MPGLYQILGLTEDATDQEIKKAYKKLAFLYHPDKTGGDLVAEEKFKEINTAYSILSNPEKRANYDFLVGQSITYQDQPKEDFEKDPTVRPHPYWGYKRPYKVNTRPKERGPSKEQRVLWDKTGKKLLVFFCVLISCSVIFGIQWEKERKRAQEAERVAYFTQKLGVAFTHYHNGDFLASFRAMPDKVNEGSPEAQLRDFVLRKTILIADSLKEMNHHHEAVKIYEEVLTFQLGKGILFATEYEAIKDNYLKYASSTVPSKQELGLLNFLIDNGYGDLDLILEKVKLYRQDTLKKPEELLRVFDQAVSYTISYYKQTFGSSFYLTIDPKKVPASHYEIFYQRALLRYELRDLSTVVEDCSWLNIIFPSKIDPYQLKYKCWVEMKKEGFICQEVNQLIQDKTHAQLGQKLHELYCDD